MNAFDFAEAFEVADKQKAEFREFYKKWLEKHPFQKGKSYKAALKEWAKQKRGKK